MYKSYMHYKCANEYDDISVIHNTSGVNKETTERPYHEKNLHTQNTISLTLKFLKRFTPESFWSRMILITTLLENYEIRKTR
jgi:hypothetical protein